jgi:2-deoxy-D-gluconate 3-dehydrogenase
LKEAADRISEASGHRVFTVCADLTRLEEVERVYQATLAEYGRVDILLYAAGTNIRKPFLEITPAEFDLIMSLNLRSVHFLSQMVAKGMIEQGEGGRILLICSISSHMGLKNASAYASSKGGVFSLAKAMAVELADHRINVNSISPGYFRTAMTEHRFKDPEQIKWMTDRIPLRRTGLPEDIGGAAVFLASPASAYLTGVNIYVDGGWTAA